MPADLSEAMRNVDAAEDNITHLPGAKHPPVQDALEARLSEDRRRGYRAAILTAEFEYQLATAPTISPTISAARMRQIEVAWATLGVFPVEGE